MNAVVTPAFLYPLGGLALAWPSSPQPGVPLIVAPLRDRQILALIRALLDATGEFDEVTTGGLPEEAGGTAEDLSLASLELAAFEESVDWNDYSQVPEVRTVQFLLWIHVRAQNPDDRDDELDRLYCVAANAINGESIGGVTFESMTFLKRGQYMEAMSCERRLKVVGQFVYEIPGWTYHNTVP